MLLKHEIQKVKMKWVQINKTRVKVTKMELDWQITTKRVKQELDQLNRSKIC